MNPSMARGATVILGAALLVGCAFADGQVRTQAASDFRCPKDDVGVESAKSGYLAYGCRKEADYVVENGQVARTSEIRATGDRRPPVPIDRIDGPNSIGIR